MSNGTQTTAEVATIKVKLPDGSVKDVPKGTTALEVAKSISPRLADAALVAKAGPLNRNGGQASVQPTAETPKATDRSVRPTQDSPKATDRSVRPTQDGPTQDGGTQDGPTQDKATLIDLTRPLEKDTELRILTERDPEALEVYRHSSAHLLAAAVLELFPETKLGHGPATESGFFYDFYRPT